MQDRSSAHWVEETTNITLHQIHKHTFQRTKCDQMLPLSALQASVHCKHLICLPCKTLKTFLCGKCLIRKESDQFTRTPVRYRGRKRGRCDECLEQDEVEYKKLRKDVLAHVACRQSADAQQPCASGSLGSQEQERKHLCFVC